MDKQYRILIVEDNDADVFLIREAIRQTGIAVQVDVIEEGARAIRFIDEAGSGGAVPLPNLVLLDLNLPRRNGDDVLRHLRQSKAFLNTKVLIVTSSDSIADRKRTKALGSDGYFRKPSGFHEFMTIGSVIREMLESGPRGAGVPL